MGVLEAEIITKMTFLKMNSTLLKLNKFKDKGLTKK